MGHRVAAWEAVGGTMGGKRVEDGFETIDGAATLLVEAEPPKVQRRYLQLKNSTCQLDVFHAMLQNKKLSDGNIKSFHVSTSIFPDRPQYLGLYNYIIRKSLKNALVVL